MAPLIDLSLERAVRSANRISPRLDMAAGSPPLHDTSRATALRLGMLILISAMFSTMAIATASWVRWPVFGFAILMPVLGYRDRRRVVRATDSGIELVGHQTRFVAWEAIDRIECSRGRVSAQLVTGERLALRALSARWPGPFRPFAVQSAASLAEELSCHRARRSSPHFESRRSIVDMSWPAPLVIEIDGTRETPAFRGMWRRPRPGR